MLDKLLLIFVVFLVSCASLDFNATSFRKTGEDENYNYYTYKSFADTVYKIDSIESEKTRIQWLQRWLDQNNLSGKNYEILKKDIFNKSGNINDIYYEIRIKK
jgi:hypothetical protein